MSSLNKCPKCQSEEIHRSRSRTKWESWRKEITGKRPYRCENCEHRWWTVDLGPQRGDFSSAMTDHGVPDPPNLKGTVLAYGPGRRDVNLAQLDNIDHAPQSVSDDES